MKTSIRLLCTGLLMGSLNAFAGGNSSVSCPHAAKVSTDVRNQCETPRSDGRLISSNDSNCRGSGQQAKAAKSGQATY